MAAGVHVGVAEKAYRNTGTFGTPVWNEMTIVIDLDLPMTKSKASVKARTSTYERFLAVIKSAPLNFKILSDTSIDDYNVLRDAWVNDTVLDLAIADQAIATSGADYWRADYYVFDFQPSQPLEEVETAQVACDMAYTANAVTGWVDVA